MGEAATTSNTALQDKEEEIEEEIEIEEDEEEEEEDEEHDLLWPVGSGPPFAREAVCIDTFGMVSEHSVDCYSVKLCAAGVGDLRRNRH